MDDNHRHAPLSEAEFLAWVEPRDGHFELVEGAVVLQAGASRDHERMAKAIFASLYAQVNALAYDVNKGDFGVRIGDGKGRGKFSIPMWWSIFKAATVRSTSRQPPW